MYMLVTISPAKRNNQKKLFIWVSSLAWFMLCGLTNSYAGKWWEITGLAGLHS